MWVWIAIGTVLLVVASASVFIAFQRPDFVEKLTRIAVKRVVKAALPSLKAIFKPKVLTAEEEAKRRAGEDINRKRPREH